MNYTENDLSFAIAYPGLVFLICGCTYSTVHLHIWSVFPDFELYLHGLFSDHVRFNSLQNYPSHDPSLYSHNNRHQNFSFRLATVTASLAAILSIQLPCDLT